jgi:hypothetical protein
MTRLVLLVALAVALAALPSRVEAQVVEGRISAGTALYAGRLTHTLELTGGVEVRLPAGLGIAGGAGLIVLEGPHGSAWVDGVVHSGGTPSRHGVSVFAAAGVTVLPRFSEGGRRARPHFRFGANFWRDASRSVLLEVAAVSEIVVVRIGVTWS